MQRVAEAISIYQTPFKHDATKIVCACLASGKIDDLALKADQSREATQLEDRKRATDFVISIGGLSAGFRLREARYFLNREYKHQFTLRCNPTLEYVAQPGGIVGKVDYHAEFEKFLNGTFADLNIYGFLTADNAKVMHWVAYRPDRLFQHVDAWVEQNVNACRKQPLPCYISYPRENHDDTYFRAISMNSKHFPADCIVAHSGYLDAITNPPQQSLFLNGQNPYH